MANFLVCFYFSLGVLYQNRLLYFERLLRCESVLEREEVVIRATENSRLQLVRPAVTRLWHFKLEVATGRLFHNELLLIVDFDLLAE